MVANLKVGCAPGDGRAPRGDCSHRKVGEPRDGCASGSKPRGGDAHEADGKPGSVHGDSSERRGSSHRDGSVPGGVVCPTEMANHETFAINEVVVMEFAKEATETVEVSGKAESDAWIHSFNELKEKAHGKNTSKEEEKEYTTTPGRNFCQRGVEHRDTR